MSVESFQNLVVGSGVAGHHLAWTLAKQGQKTVVVERSMINGSCPNVACLPSKNLIYSAKTVSLVDPSRGLGVVSGKVEVDRVGVARRKRNMVEGFVQRARGGFEASGAELVLGEARFVGPKTVQATLNDGGVRLLQGERVFINVGTRAAVPNIPGLREAGPMTHVEALDLERTPEHVVVLGGGYVGLEFAQTLRRLGSRVTVVQRGARLLGREDADASDALLELMKDEGVEVLLRAEASSVEGRSGQGVKLRVRIGSTESVLKASDILVAAGRTPNTDRLDLAGAGVEMDARGFIRVDEKLRTTAPDVWATGECAGSPQFTHVGFDDFRVVMSDLAGGSRTTRGRLIPSCLFTDPELVRVGLNEAEAKAAGVPHRVVRIPMSRVPRTHTIHQTRGFMKALIGPDDRILGFAALGAEASELLAVVQTAMVGGMPYTTLRDTIYAHPTASEGLIALFTEASAPPGRR